MFSNPLVSTWVFHETVRILFDAGDGVSSHLDGLVHKVKLAALTHSHRDHCAGLMQFLNLRAGAGDFTTVYPTGSGSAKTLAGFLTTFDSRSTAFAKWKTLDDGETIPIEPDRHFLRAFATDHYPPMDDIPSRSVGYQIVRHVDKLKAEFAATPQEELDRIRFEKGRSFLTETIEDILFTISGDTRPLDPQTFAGSRVLMHECTLLDSSERESMNQRSHPHSALDEVIRIADEAKVGRLGLYHISRRYDDERILSRVREECRKVNLKCPVSVALPGRFITDLFSHVVWKGSEDVA